MASAVLRCVRPGGLVLIRDYGLLDLSHLRFPEGKRLGERLYQRRARNRGHWVPAPCAAGHGRCVCCVLRAALRQCSCLPAPPPASHHVESRTLLPPRISPLSLSLFLARSAHSHPSTHHLLTYPSLPHPTRPTPGCRGDGTLARFFHPDELTALARQVGAEPIEVRGGGKSASES